MAELDNIQAYNFERGIVMISGQKNYKLMDPKVDFAFKKIFSDSTTEGKIALISLLNAILGLTEDGKITDILYLNPFSDEEYADEKQSIMDIKVKTQDDKEIDIEMQINDSDNYRKRSLYYLSKMYGSQLVKGQVYEELTKCIVISILDFNLLKEAESYHTMFHMVETKGKFELIDDLELHYIELKKFREYNNIESMDLLSKWVIFIKYAADDSKKELMEKVRMQEEAIDMAVSTLLKLSQDEKERIKYEDRQKWLLDIESRQEYARRKGLKEEKVRITKKMIAKGSDIADIVELTELTEEEVMKLKEELKLQ